MSDVKHTPGPWAYDADSGEIYFDDGDVCPLIATVNLELASEEQAKADAHLIAAAPELLAALKTAIDFGEDGKRLVAAQGGDLIIRLPDSTVSLIRRAIAKAEGRAS